MRQRAREAMQRAAALAVGGSALVACALPQVVPPTSTPASSAGAALCDRLAGADPTVAADRLEAAGLAVEWRFEYTGTAGPVSEPAAIAPDGSVTNVVVEDDRALIFVTPLNDPLQELAPEEIVCAP